MIADQHPSAPTGPPTRGAGSGPGPRLLVAGCLALALVLGLDACAGQPSAAEAPETSAATSVDQELAARVDEIVTEQMAADHLRAVIVRVTVDGGPVITQAYGESAPGVPASTAMHFRGGAMSIPMMSTVLLQLVDEGEVILDDPLAAWLPDVPHSDQVTLGQLARMTSGYPDYVQDEDFVAAVIADPFRTWTPEMLVAIATSKPLHYTPGTNWNYSHTNYVLLGLALEQITGTPLDRLIQDRVLDPLGLEQTGDPGSPAIPEPVLRAWSAERREHLGIPAGTVFVEESTDWNPSWTLARGGIQTTDITDMATTIEAIGAGTLLSPQSHALQVSTDLRGRTSAVEGCPTCFPQSKRYSYGLGMVTSGDWILQNPMFSGYSGVAAALPGQGIAIAVAVTYEEEAFDETGEVSNRAQTLYSRIGAAAAPDNPPPTAGR